MPAWTDIGSLDELSRKPLQQVTAGRTKLAVSFVNGEIGAISGVCNHAGGPLGEGRLDGGYVVCPWHNWKFHRARGEGEPGFEEDCVPRYEVKVESGRVFVDLDSATKRRKAPHAPHPLSRPVLRQDGPIRVIGISTSVMDESNPRYSTSDALLDSALSYVQSHCGAEAKLIRLNALQFRACEGYYSKSAQACTWPCSITQMDANDQLDVVYDAFVHWADVILISTPIRWGSASSLYFKMVERMNCIQNQITIRNRILMKNKVAAFIITGGQDNVQAVAGQMLGFFAEIGCAFPQFPYVAHSRGWSAEDMERNVAYVKTHEELHDAARALAARAVETAQFIIKHSEEEERPAPMVRAGRKASGMTTRKAAPMSLYDTQLQLHYSLQAAAGIGRTLLPKQPDDSHQSFTWSQQNEALVQGVVDGKFRSGLRLRDMTLLLIGPNDRVAEEFPLRGKTLDDGFRFYEERVGAMIVRPGEPLPPHPIANGAIFAPPPDELASLAALYGDAAAILERLRAKHAEAGPVRCWPHHFDIDVVLSFGENHGIGAGFLGGDANIPEPYWYVYTWPTPSSAPKLSVGTWYDTAWKGALLKGRHEPATVEKFLEEAIGALR